MSKGNARGYTVAIQREATDWNLRCLSDNARIIGENISSTDQPPLHTPFANLFGFRLPTHQKFSVLTDVQPR